MGAKRINIVATIVVMAMVITAANAGTAGGGGKHAYADCFHKCSPSCFAPTVDHRCLINCDIKCHGSAIQQFAEHCKNSCLKHYCTHFQQDIKKRVCETSCTTFCHVKG